MNSEKNTMLFHFLPLNLASIMYFNMPFILPDFDIFAKLKVHVHENVGIYGTRYVLGQWEKRLCDRESAITCILKLP